MPFLKVKLASLFTNVTSRSTRIILTYDLSSDRCLVSVPNRGHASMEARYSFTVWLFKVAYKHLH